MTQSLSAGVIAIIKKSLDRYFEALSKLSTQEGLLELTKTDLNNEAMALMEVRDKIGIQTTSPPTLSSYAR